MRVFFTWGAACALLAVLAVLPGCRGTGNAPDSAARLMARGGDGASEAERQMRESRHLARGPSSVTEDPEGAPPYLGSQAHPRPRNRRLPYVLRDLHFAKGDFGFSTASGLTRRDLLETFEDAVNDKLEAKGVNYRIGARLAPGIPDLELSGAPVIGFSGGVKALLEEMHSPLGSLTWRFEGSGGALARGHQGEFSFFDRERKVYAVRLPPRLSGGGEESEGPDLAASFRQTAEFFLRDRDSGYRGELNLATRNYEVSTLPDVHEAFGRKVVQPFNDRAGTGIAVEFGAFVVSRRKSKDLDFRVRVTERAGADLNTSVSPTTTSQPTGGTATTQVNEEAVNALAQANLPSQIIQLGEGVAVTLGDIRRLGSKSIGFGTSFLSGLQDGKFWSSQEFFRYFHLSDGEPFTYEDTFEKTIRIGQTSTTQGSGDSSTTTSGDNLREIKVGRELRVRAHLAPGGEIDMAYRYETSSNNAEPSGNETSSTGSQNFESRVQLPEGAWKLLDFRLIGQGDRERSGIGHSSFLLGGRRYDLADEAKVFIMARAYRITPQDRRYAARLAKAREDQARFALAQAEPPRERKKGFFGWFRRGFRR